MHREKWLTAAMAAILVVAVCGSGRAGEEVTATRPEESQSAPTGDVAAQPQQQVQINPAELFAIVAGDAEKGNVQAMLNLGTLYENGVGVRRNYTKAYEWYGKAAAANLPEGYMRLGACYEIGVGTTVDIEKAFLNYEKAAELKDPNGLYKLAEMYIHGLGVKQNQSWGVSLLQRAMEAGHAGAANDLGMVHFQGLYGNEKDDSKAMEMFAAAADLGNGEAMKNLGLMYREGINVDADPIESMKWYMLAFDSGFNQQGLMPVLNDMSGEMDEEDIEEARSRARAWVEALQAKRQAEQPAAAQ